MAATGISDAGPASGRRRGAPKRRRGPALEAALLEAAWDELTEVGYAALTMEGVATRARTSRAVLYRRWPSRPELVIAALRQHAAINMVKFPDTGTLRDDLLAVLRHISTWRGEEAAVLSFLIAGALSETGLSPAALRERILSEIPRPGIATIIARAVARGEIDSRRLSPRICSLPMDLVRHDLIMTQAPVPDATLVEIVDTIFLPLVRA